MFCCDAKHSDIVWGSSHIRCCLFFVFLIEFCSTKGWTATMTHGVKEYEKGKDRKDIEKLFKKSPRKSVC